MPTEPYFFLREGRCYETMGQRIETTLGAAEKS